MEKSEIQAILNQLNLSVSFVFVPFSQSRNKAEKNLSLNYMAAIKCAGRDVFTCEYMQGIAHAPSYTQGRQTVDQARALKREAETGKTSTYGTIKIKDPDPVDFFYCIVSDCDVLNYSGFEGWASSLGYETDSRKAEKIYQECLHQALAMRNAVGEAGLTQLQTAYEDF